MALADFQLMILLPQAPTGCITIQAACLPLLILDMLDFLNFSFLMLFNSDIKYIVEVIKRICSHILERNGLV